MLLLPWLPARVVALTQQMGSPLKPGQRTRSCSVNGTKTPPAASVAEPRSYTRAALARVMLPSLPPMRVRGPSTLRNTTTAVSRCWCFVFPSPPPVYVTLQDDSCDSIQTKFQSQLAYGLAACNQGASARHQPPGPSLRRWLC